MHCVSQYANAFMYMPVMCNAVTSFQQISIWQHCMITCCMCMSTTVRLHIVMFIYSQQIILSVWPLPRSGACPTAKIKVFAEEPLSKCVRQHRSVLGHSFFKPETGYMLKASLCSCTAYNVSQQWACMRWKAKEQGKTPAAMHSKEFAVIGSITNLSWSFPSSLFSKQCARPCAK